MKQWVIVYLSLCLLFIVPQVSACKDIIVCGDASKGDYNLLLKIRDPSRPGFQVLCIVPEGYSYSYHHPWTGEPVEFTNHHKYIGVASRNDTIPSVVKAGMMISDAGLAFGDADTNSRWVNPSRYAWDDFDWLRYACENSNDTSEAVYCLTVEVVDRLHAPGVSENLFIIGPSNGYVIEADAYRYHVKEIKNGVDVLSNYPRELWGTEWFRTRLISSSFDVEVQKTVETGDIIHLGSLLGVQVLSIDKDSVTVREYPYLLCFLTYRNQVWEPVTIRVGDRETVGDFSVTLLNITDDKAILSVEPVVRAWQNKILEYVNSRYGSITVRDLMNWSRLHEEDLDGLRAMCEHMFMDEGAAIYRIPSEHYDILGGGWFSPSHPCSSIYVPFHIADNKVFEPYMSGEAAELSFKLSLKGNLTGFIERVEEVFLYENEFIEDLALRFLSNASQLLTCFDVNAQRQAWLMEQLLYKLDDPRVIEGMWSRNYSSTLESMRNIIHCLGEELLDVQRQIGEIALIICETGVEELRIIGYSSMEAEDEFKSGRSLIEQEFYEDGLYHLQLSYNLCLQQLNRILGERNSDSILPG
ncbi:MAG TPA: hypothetical protein ENG62_02205, partial [Thermoplasmatales archaeon]|nr:hypothetical protein [Thermoplasmatales archaeon]